MRQPCTRKDDFSIFLPSLTEKSRVGRRFSDSGREGLILVHPPSPPAKAFPFSIFFSKRNDQVVNNIELGCSIPVETNTVFCSTRMPAIIPQRYSTLAGAGLTQSNPVIEYDTILHSTRQLQYQVANAQGMCYGNEHSHSHTHTSHTQTQATTVKT